MIKLSVNETKWSSLLARTRAFIPYISIWIFDLGPVKLPGLSRNGPQYENEAGAWITIYQLIITLTKFVIYKPFFKIKTEEIPNFFASSEKKPFKHARDGAYCPIT